MMVHAAAYPADRCTHDNTTRRLMLRRFPQDSHERVLRGEPFNIGLILS